MLINQLEELFESFINLINTAIDEKSPYTGGHCQRVPALTMMLAEAVNETSDGPLADFRMTDKDRYELKIAGLLHDCGKVTTPVHVVDKATKLETIFDRIHLIDTRFEVLKRDAEIEHAAGASWRCCEHEATRAGARCGRRASPRTHRGSSTTTASSCARCNIGGERMARRRPGARAARSPATAGRNVDGARGATSSPTTS